jgi:hypothetical protein
MKHLHVSSAGLASAVVILLLCSVFSQAQQTVATNTNVAVPPLINFSGTLTDANGKPLTGTAAITFSLYSEQTSGAALWMETQNVQPDSHGNYTVMLGSTSSTGLPSDIFVAGEAHWLGVQVQGQPEEQPRVLLVSAPYALKAGDAQTVGGLPPSAFVLAAPPSSGMTTTNSPPTAAVVPASGSPLTTSDVTTTGGTVNALPLFTTATNIQNSLLTQTGKTGINVGGKLNLPATGAATSSAGKDSQAHTFVASSYNSSTSAAVAQTFQLQAEPAGNDTATPSGTLNLLFGSGTTAPAETGLKIASDGQITFATGQTFPGTGEGTVTSVGSGSGLTGGPITSSGSLSIATAGVANAMLAHSSLTVTAGTGLTGGGSVALGGTTTLNVNTATVPLLNSANSFTANQAITGNLTDTGNISVTGEITAQYEHLTNDSFTPTLYISQSGNGNGIFVNAPGASEAIEAMSSTAGSTGVLGGSTNGTGVVGTDIATSGPSTGVEGVSASSSGVGVAGQATSTSTSATGVGVLGTSASGTGIGVEGQATNTNNLTFGIGVYGTASSPLEGIGVEGTAAGIASEGGFFVGGPSGTVSPNNFPGGAGLQAEGGEDASSAGYGGGIGGMFTGGGSDNGPGGTGVEGEGGVGLGSIAGYPVAGVMGIGPFNSSQAAADGPGVFGNDGALSTTGSYFVGIDAGIWGDVSQSGGLGFGTPSGVSGTADNALAMLAENNSATYPAFDAVNLSTSSTAAAFQAFASAAVATIGGTGCSGTIGLQLGLLSMSSNCENYTLQGDTSGNTYLNASGSGKIVFRINNGSGPSPMSLNNNGSVTITSLDVTSSLTKPSGSFKIDHPLDPANKYLYHSFVESPDMKNIYDGNITTDSQGLATVTMPDWFEALNRDFRYQLTVIGQFAQAIVAQEIENNQFQIRTSLPNVKVSWQVTGIRQDAFANAHRIQTEVEKAPADRGHYLHPELFGAPETARIGYEAPSVLAPAGEKSASTSARPATAGRPRQLMRPNRPLPVLPKLPKPLEVKTPPKPTVAQTSK